MAVTDLTYKNLQDRCLSFGYGEVDRTNFKTWINMTQTDIFTRRRWSWQAATENVVTVAGTQSITLTTLADLPLVWGRLKPTLNTVAEPKWVDEMAFSDDWPRHALTATDIGMPQAYSIWAGILMLYPIPDAVYTYSLRYWKGAIDMVNDGDLSIIPAQWRNVLVQGALCYASERDRDDRALARRTGKFEATIHQMKTVDNFPQAEVSRKARMPKTYHNMYDGGSGLWRP